MPWRRPGPPPIWKPSGSSYLGKKGELTAVLKQMGKLSAEERPVMGQLANDVRAALEAAIEARSEALAAGGHWHARLQAETVDVTIPGKKRGAGPQAPHVHCAGRDQGDLHRHGL